MFATNVRKTCCSFAQNKCFERVFCIARSSYKALIRNPEFGSSTRWSNWCIWPSGQHSCQLGS